MRWTVTFLHNDSSYTDVTVDEKGLAGVFAYAMKREFPCHVIAFEEVPEEPVHVRYWLTDDGDEERCVAERVPAPVGDACDHCGAAFTDDDTDAIRLTPEDGGEPHTMHERCALEDVDGPDMPAIKALVLIAEQR